MGKIQPALLLVLAATMPLMAKDEKGNAGAKAAARQKAEARQKAAARAAVRDFRRRFSAAKNKAGRMNAMLTLSLVKHDLVIDELGKLTLKYPEPDVRDAAAQLLGTMGFDSERAGKYLKKGIAVNDSRPGVVLSTFRAIGKLGYLGARSEIESSVRRHLGQPSYRWANVEGILTFGVLKDVKALPFLVQLVEFHVHPPRKAPTGDRSRKFRKGSGAGTGYGGRKVVDKYWAQPARETVEKILGRKFKDGVALRKWFDTHRKEILKRKPAKAGKKAGKSTSPGGAGHARSSPK